VEKRLPILLTNNYSPHPDFCIFQFHIVIVSPAFKPRILLLSKLAASKSCRKHPTHLRRLLLFVQAAKRIFPWTRNCAHCSEFNHFSLLAMVRKISYSSGFPGQYNPMSTKPLSPEIRCRPLSALEELPTEILQEIYRWSRNLNLPLSSPHISLKLSSNIVYTWTCDYAFYNPWPVRSPIRTEVQQQLFSRRWMTWQFFKQYLIRFDHPDACMCWHILLGQQCDGQRYPSCLFSLPTRACRGGRLNNQIGIKSISCPIPTKLTRGPFLPDKVAFLQFLLKETTMSIDRADREAIRTATRGRREAIRDRKYDVSYLFAHSRRLGNAVTLELIKFAIIDCNCDRSIVFDLMIAAKESKWSWWNDVELDAWVARQEAAGNPKGRWLKVKLEELRGGQWPKLETANYEAADVLQILPVSLPRYYGPS